MEKKNNAWAKGIVNRFFKNYFIFKTLKNDEF